MTKSSVAPINLGKLKFSSSWCTLLLTNWRFYEPLLSLDVLPSSRSKWLIYSSDILSKDLIIPATSPTETLYFSVFYSFPWGLDTLSCGYYRWCHTSSSSTSSSTSPASSNHDYVHGKISKLIRDTSFNHLILTQWKE